MSDSAGATVVVSDSAGATVVVSDSAGATVVVSDSAGATVVVSTVPGVPFLNTIVAVPVVAVTSTFVYALSAICVGFNLISPSPTSVTTPDVVSTSFTLITVSLGLLSAEKTI